MNSKQGRFLVILLGAALLPAFTSGAQLLVTKFATGGFHTLYLMNDGSLWGMGNEDYGELGDGIGTPNLRRYPPEVIVDGGVTAIAAGDYHSLFIKNGGLWAMGGNSDGELGDGTTSNALIPEQIVPSGVTAIAAGSFHSLYITKKIFTTRLWAMGNNDSGQLGDGTTNNRPTPVNILSYTSPQVGSPVIAVSGGETHSLFLKSNGSLWAMGNNVLGQLGDGTTDGGKYASYAPEQIVSSGVTAISAGENHSLFLKSDGSLWGMGANYFGQLGDGTTSTAKTPEQIVPSSVTAISAGQIHSLFLKNDGSLWAMGDNQYGELGDGTTTHALTPEQIVPSGVIAIAAGEFFSLFLKSDGSVWFMGYGYGVGIPGQINSSPVLYGAAYPPSLAITTVGGQPAVIYPLAGTNYVLQMTTNLASLNWVPAAVGTPAIAVIYTNTTPGAAFFRLR